LGGKPFGEAVFYFGFDGGEFFSEAGEGFLVLVFKGFADGLSKVAARVFDEERDLRGEGFYGRVEFLGKGGEFEGGVAGLFLGAGFAGDDSGGELFYVFEGGFEAFGFGGAEGVYFLLKRFIFGDVHFVELGFEFADFFLEAGGERVGVLEHSGRGFGDVVEVGGGDAELVGGGGGGLGDCHELVLAFVEEGVAAAGVVEHDRHAREHGAEADAGRDCDERERVGRGRGFIGDQECRDEQHNVGDDKGQWVELGCLFWMIHWACD
jgi:hypothetical protein